MTNEQELNGNQQAKAKCVKGRGNTNWIKIKEDKLYNKSGSTLKKRKGRKTPRFPGQV